MAFNRLKLVSSLGRDTSPASNPKLEVLRDILRTHFTQFQINTIKTECLYQVYKNWSSARFLTIRPHDHYIFGRYGVLNHQALMEEYRKLFNDLIQYPFMGSVEKNNNHFIHFHLIIFTPTKAQFKELMIKLREKLSLEYNLKQKDYTVREDILETPQTIRRFVLYHLGYKYQLNAMKESFLTNILNSGIQNGDYDCESLNSLEDFIIEDLLVKKTKRDKSQYYKIEGYIHEPDEVGIKNVNNFLDQI